MELRASTSSIQTESLFEYKRKLLKTLSKFALNHTIHIA